jgi:hypothetical protein
VLAVGPEGAGELVQESTYHLGYSRYVVIAAAYKGNQSFPGILAQDPYAGKPQSLLLEILVRSGPFPVEVGEIGVEVEI